MGKHTNSIQEDPEIVSLALKQSLDHLSGSQYDLRPCKMQHSLKQSILILL